jgi:hypothetical protein
MISPAYALLPLIAILALLLWLQMRRGDRLVQENHRHQFEVMSATEEALRWRQLAERAIGTTSEMAGTAAEGNLDPGLLIQAAGALQRAHRLVASPVADEGMGNDHAALSVA